MSDTERAAVVAETEAAWQTSPATGTEALATVMQDALQAIAERGEYRGVR
jgi:hypothetical protein